MANYACRALGGTFVYNDDPNVNMVLINGQPVTVISGTLTITSAIGRRSTASMTVRTQTATYFQQYQQVLIYDGSNTLIFSGYITSPKTQKPGFQNSLLHQITCADKHFLADKRIVTAAYTNKTCGYIINDIVTNILSQEGVTYVDNYPSAVVPQATFVYAKVSDVFDGLTKQASTSGVPYYWQINEENTMIFAPYTAVVNSLVVDGTKIESKNNPPTVTRANPNYRNTQYGIDGTSQTVTQTETRKGDGNTQAWSMGYDLSTVPTIKVNTVAKTTGIKGIDTGKDFYWAQGDPVIAQDSAGTILISTDTLQVVYVGQFPTVFFEKDNSQIAYQAGIDGTSGIVEEVESNSALTSATAGLSFVGNLLTTYAQQGVLLTFTTLQTGFQQGQLLTVNLPDFGLYNAAMLVENITFGDSYDGINIWYQVTAIQGPYDGNWVYFFNRLLSGVQAANALNIGSSSATSLLKTVSLASSTSINFTGTVFACPVPSSILYPSPTLYPC